VRHDAYLATAARVSEVTADTADTCIASHAPAPPQTLNILRAFATGGYADISRLHAWNLDFVEQTEPGSRCGFSHALSQPCTYAGNRSIRLSVHTPCAETLP
jgi:3-deoxy-D-arabino-heptulosonate 7-phosphate (DAHP) synthase class II